MEEETPPHPRAGSSGSAPLPCGALPGAAVGSPPRSVLVPGAAVGPSLESRLGLPCSVGLPLGAVAVRGAASAHPPRRSPRRGWMRREPWAGGLRFWG